ncbi:MULTISPECIES: light-harvesting antenna LH1, alpha subunit [Thiorhodovibrio]|jgi:light-harvesting complex 1 alpha chain|uniref:light-harvesting antenna LH1, alpha subunit n=1 Tax=Thiorhodovibrio TaxID=61593 RepID=UPI001F5DBA34|nr:MULTISPECIES: light-harvesting antenna LH1, alpha subunit [Thiorhodovibrio]WPL14391.1 light-harvesting protein, PufA [Thiorhodovibrio litoralis]
MSTNNMAGMYKIWTFFDPRRTLVAIAGFQLVLGLLIHFILLGSDLNWLDDGIPTSYMGAATASVGQMSAMPETRTIN